MVQLQLAEGPEPGTPRTLSDAFQAVLDAYVEAATQRAELAGDRKPRRPRLKMSSGRGKTLAARIQEHGEDAAVLVVRWWQLAPDDRARLLRGEVPGKGPYGWKTVVRPANFEEYLEKAEQWHDDGADVAPPGASPSDQREAEEAWAFLRRCIGDRSYFREHCRPDDPEWPHGVRPVVRRLGKRIQTLRLLRPLDLEAYGREFINAHTQYHRKIA